MKRNLLSLEKLLEKGYMIIIEDNMIKVHERNIRLILKAPFSKNITFKIGIQVLEHKCFAFVVFSEKWSFKIQTYELNEQEEHATGSCMDTNT